MDDKRVPDEQLTDVSGGDGYQGRTIAYVVRPGDTIPAIAKKFGTTVRLIMQVNALGHEFKLESGARLMIPTH